MYVQSDDEPPRTVAATAAVIAAIAALGIKPEQVLAAEGDVLKCRMDADIQVLDPGYMIGGAGNEHPVRLPAAARDTGERRQ